MSVSIVIPTYKRPHYLDRLLASVAKQSWNEFEVIVVDDNSNIPEYAQVVEKYSSLLPEFTFLSNDTTCGAPYSRNRGINAAKYDLIALVDDDDEWLPTKLEKQVDAFAKSGSGVGLVYTWTDAVDEEGTVVHTYRSCIEGQAVKQILAECFIPSPSVMVRKSAICAAGLFDERFPSCQDWDMWTRILSKGYECRVVKEVVTIYHKHSSPSIGMSPSAIRGYKMFYLKHLSLAFRAAPSSFVRYLKFLIRNHLQ